jgi:tripartite-type tricarboxylate transporter receptor subunit TctC
MLRKNKWLAGFTCWIMAAGAVFANDPTYPEKPISIVVSFAPGSANDLMGRTVAKRLTDSLPRPAVVENRPGAGGMVGAGHVARSKPDGYTLLLGSTSMVTSQLVHKAPGYDVMKDFVPVGMVASAAMGVFINASHPATTLAEFVASAKKNPDKVFYSSSGVGGIMHIEGERFALESGIKGTHVPYSGGAPAIQALLANEVQYVVIDVGFGLPLLRTGKLKLLAVGASQRLAQAPEVPTFGELGLSFSPSLWYGVLAPANTSQTVLNVLRDQLTRLLRDNEYKSMIQTLNAQVPAINHEQFKSLIEKDLAAYRDVITKAKIESK